MSYGIAHAKKYDADGRFGLSWMPLHIMTADDLGRGSGDCSCYFMTEEGRTYFMQAEAVREKLAQCAADLGWAQEQLWKIADKKEKRRKKRLERLGLTVTAVDTETNTITLE